MSGDEVDTSRFSLLLKSNMGKTVEKIILEPLQEELSQKFVDQQRRAIHI
jgi:hypothetical protein